MICTFTELVRSTKVPLACLKHLLETVMKLSLNGIPPQREEKRHDLENIFGDHSRTPAAELFKFTYHVLIHCLIRTSLMGGESDR